MSGFSTRNIRTNLNTQESEAMVSATLVKPGLNHLVAKSFDRKMPRLSGS